LKSWRTGLSFAAKTHVLAVVAPTAPAAYSLGVASGVDAPLSTCSHVLDGKAQAGAQTVACGDETLSQKQKNTRQMRKRSADEHKNRVNITSFIGTEARYPSGRCIFEELVTWP
jgi:hypothetical protein